MLLYRVTNRINGKVYIGKWQGGSAQERWSQHVAEAGRGSRRYFCNAIRKWGTAAFSVEEIYKAKTPYELARMETFFIILHQSHLSENGYNRTLGGERMFGVMLGKRHSEASRRKMRLSHIGKPNHQLGRKATPETVEKLRSSHLGKKRTLESVAKGLITRKQRGHRSGMLGKTHSEETRQRMRESQRARFAKAGA